MQYINIPKSGILLPVFILLAITVFGQCSIGRCSFRLTTEDLNKYTGVMLYEVYMSLDDQIVDESSSPLIQRDLNNRNEAHFLINFPENALNWNDEEEANENYYIEVMASNIRDKDGIVKGGSLDDIRIASGDREKSIKIPLQLKKASGYISIPMSIRDGKGNGKKTPSNIRIRYEFDGPEGILSSPQVQARTVQLTDNEYWDQVVRPKMLRYDSDKRIRLDEFYLDYLSEYPSAYHKAEAISGLKSFYLDRFNEVDKSSRKSLLAFKKKYPQSEKYGGFGTMTDDLLKGLPEEAPLQPAVTTTNINEQSDAAQEQEESDKEIASVPPIENEKPESNTQESSTATDNNGNNSSQTSPKSSNSPVIPAAIVLVLGIIGIVIYRESKK
jgi:hypothetical protein